MGSNSVRVSQGEVVFVLAWSNVATTMHGVVHLIPDLLPGDKSPPSRIIATPDFATGSARALTSASVTIPAAGVIDEVAIATPSGSPAQRGQLFVQMVLVQANLSGSVTLFQGYVYTGNVGALGQIVEPGPAGGHGNLRRILTADPAANAEVAVQIVPTGAIWRPESYSVQLVQGITQTPLPTLRIRDGVSAAIISQVPITTTAIGASSTAQLTWGRGIVQSSFTAVVGDEFHTAPIPLADLVAGDDVGTLTDGIGANTNYGAALFTVEEWVMPN